MSEKQQQKSSKKQKKAARAAAAAARRQQKLREARYAEAVEQGGLKMAAGKYDEAVEQFTVAVEISPSDANSFGARGHCYSLLGRHEDALNDFSSVIAVNPQDDNAYVRRARARAQRRVRGVPLRSEDFKQVIDDLTAAVHLNRYNFQAFAARGDALFDCYEYAAALDDYNEAVTIFGNYGYGHSRRANCILRIARMSKDAMEAAEAKERITFADLGNCPGALLGHSALGGVVPSRRPSRGGSDAGVAAAPEGGGDGDGEEVAVAPPAHIVLSTLKGSRGAALSFMDRKGLTTRAMASAVAAEETAQVRLPSIHKVTYLTSAPGLVDRRMMNDSSQPAARHRPNKAAAEQEAAAAVRPPSARAVEARADLILAARARRKAAYKQYEDALESIERSVASYQTKAKDGTITAYAPLSVYSLKVSILCDMRRVEEAEASLELVRGALVLLFSAIVVAGSVVSLWFWCSRQARTVSEGDGEKLQRLALLERVELHAAASVVEAAKGGGAVAAKGDASVTEGVPPHAVAVEAR